MRNWPAAGSGQPDDSGHAGALGCLEPFAQAAALLRDVAHVTVSEGAGPTAQHCGGDDRGGAADPGGPADR